MPSFLRRLGALSILFTALMADGCMLTSLETRRNYFREDRDAEIGTSITRIPMQLHTETWVLSEDTEGYLFTYKDKPDCRWILEVDRQTNVVIAWRYAGPPDNCYTRFSWLGAW